MLGPLAGLLDDPGIQGAAVDRLVGTGVGIAVVRLDGGATMRKLSGPRVQEMLAQAVLETYSSNYRGYYAVVLAKPVNQQDSSNYRG
eukprot:SAG31_NODE_6912_length_1852_cov_1.944128_2_plen_86_part_01